MASLTIRRLKDESKERLRVRAALQGRSMEEEARHILRAALGMEAQASTNLAAAIGARFEGVGGVELERPEREPMREPPRLDT